MRRSNTRWLPRSTLAAALVLTALAALPGCVTRGTYREVVAERDQLREERDGLQMRVDRLETSTQALQDERVDLFDQIEGLRQTRQDLETQKQRAERELEATNESLEATNQALEAQRRARAAAMEEVERLRSTYDSLVTDLQTEVETGRVQLERLRDGTGFSLPDDVLFPPGSTRPSAAGRKLVHDLAGRLANVMQLIEVHGHTDSIPTSGALAERYPTNWELAGARAASVVRILVEGGVPAERLVAVSHGASLPIAPNDTPDGRARNRRIEILLRPLPAPGSAGAPLPEAP
jgi:chemotaxis protein MotB